MSDSDFSDYEDEFEDSSSSVLLGFADKSINRNELLSVTDNRLGGQPTWFDSEPSLDLVKCKICKELMPLLVQIFAPLEGTYYDRVLYVFGCKKPSCRRRDGSIRAIRGVKRDSQKERLEKEKEEEESRKQENEERKAREIEKEKAKTMASIGDKIFDNEPAGNPFSNPFGSNPFDNKEEKIESKPSYKGKEKEKSKPSTPAPCSTPTPNISTAFPQFPGYFIQVEGEILTPRKIEPVKVDTAAIDEDGFEGSGNGSNLGKAAEAAAANIDPVFQKFVDLVDNNPDQVLRYERPAVPILYSSKDDIIDIFKNNKIPKCPISGNRRILELQIMPHAIMVLEESYQEDDIITNGMEWGTIFVATSEDDAMPPLDDNGVGYAEEWVGVQWEEVITH